MEENFLPTALRKETIFQKRFLVQIIQKMKEMEHIFLDDVEKYDVFSKIHLKNQFSIQMICQTYTHFIQEKGQKSTLLVKLSLKIT